MAKKTKYDILSPDGFSIDREKTYNTREEVLTAFEEWKERFKAQGYYSSNNGRIPLDELENYCELVTV